MTRTSPDYQQHIDAKLPAIPLPDFKGLKVLDVGCDHGFWCFMAAKRGAAQVVGIDRGREVRGQGHVDLATANQAYANGAKMPVTFKQFDIGKQWPDLGRFDVILLMSLYHHIYENCGDHKAIWYWLWRHCKLDGHLIWEGPLDDSDKVVQHNVSAELRGRYNEAEIMAASLLYFDQEYIGPAMHEENRHVFRFTPKRLELARLVGTTQTGAGGATQAFIYRDNSRIKAIGNMLDIAPYPGSLNIKLERPFDWSKGYYRAELEDVVERGKGLNVEWRARWCRFYPVLINGHEAFAMRFEGEKYPDTLVELVANTRLRHHIGDDNKMITICRCL